ncbi:MAG: anti-sigma factor family protein [Pyrinomonadaceae bacterium]
MNDFTENRCQVEDVAAYIDGELSGIGLDLFEAHLKSCVDCAEELRAQRQLLCTLDVAFGGSRSFNLPKNFTRVVTARAESDLSGMRNKGERRRALQLCIALALVSFALLGAAVRTVVFDPIWSFFRVAGSVLHLAWQATSEAAASAAIVVRVLARAILFSENGLGLLLAIFLLFISCLPFLLAKYRRAQIVE